jgi:LacI family transcriptional regulator
VILLAGRKMARKAKLLRDLRVGVLLSNDYTETQEKPWTNLHMEAGKQPIKREAASQVPILIANNYLAVKNSYAVVSDDVRGVNDAVTYLAKLGRRDIYYFLDAKYPAALAKKKGFQQGMQEHGLNSGNTVEVPYGQEGGSNGLLQLIDNGKRISAVICGEDITAVGVMKACAKLKLRVPEDVSVIGYNDSILTEVATPTLTSINNHTQEMALAAADKLYELLQDKKVSRKTIFISELVIRDSTGPAPL